MLSASMNNERGDSRQIGPYTHISKHASKAVVREGVITCDERREQSGHIHTRSDMSERGDGFFDEGIAVAGDSVPQVASYARVRERRQLGAK